MNVLPFVHPFYSHILSHSLFCHLPPRDNTFHVPLVIGVYAHVYLVWESRGLRLWLPYDIEKGLPSIPSKPMIMLTWIHSER